MQRGRRTGRGRTVGRAWRPRHVSECPQPPRRRLTDPQERNANAMNHRIGFGGARMGVALVALAAVLTPLLGAAPQMAGAAASAGACTLYVSPSGSATAAGTAS